MATTMKAIKLVAPVKITDGKIENKEVLVPVDVPIPEPAAGEVLIRVSRSALNPSDLGTLSGWYGKGFGDDGGLIPGIEGSGVVVKNNAGDAGEAFVGKRVAYYSWNASSYAEYVAVAATNVIVMPEGVSDDAGAYAFVNPLTVIGFVKYAKENNHKAIVHNVGASALGKMLVRYAAHEGVKLLSLVRRASQVADVVAAGADAADVLVTTDGDFAEKYAAWAKEHNATLAYDAIGGDATGVLAAGLPARSIVRVYGFLSGQPSKIGVQDLLFQYKQVTGYWLSVDLADRGPAALPEWLRIVEALLPTVLKTDVTAAYALDKVADGVETYSATMTGGKVTVAPNAPAGVVLKAGETHPSDRP